MPIRVVKYNLERTLKSLLSFEVNSTNIDVVFTA